jgi:hypothetical protein
MFVAPSHRTKGGVHWPVLTCKRSWKKTSSNEYADLIQIHGYGNNKTYDELFSSGGARSGLTEPSRFFKSKTPG